MKAHVEYIEWRDTKGLNEDIKKSISDLKFLRDELHFLRDLAAAHTLEIIYGTSHEAAQKIAANIHMHENKGQRLIKDLRAHSNNLQTLIDEIDVPRELKDYKNTHYKLMVETMDFYCDVKKTKRNIFEMLSTILKSGKKKKQS